jgi:4a-hydroxytetrahydrobiopterin dehydratase
VKVQSASLLVGKTCKPCEGGVEAYGLTEAQEQLRELAAWSLSEDGKSIVRKWQTKNFAQAMKLLNSVAELAEQDQHHPDLHLTGYRHVRIELTTHAIGGLSENDFILAAKIDLVAEATGL